VTLKSILLRMLASYACSPSPGPHYKECPFCKQWLHMTPDPTHRSDCIVVEARRKLGQPNPEKAFRPDRERAEVRELKS
jgi:hypothetical protein